MSFRDDRGVVHRTDVHASTILEAAAMGLKQIRETEMLDGDAVYDIVVEVTTITRHEVSTAKLQAWLERSTTPKDRAMKARLRG